MPDDYQDHPTDPERRPRPLDYAQSAGTFRIPSSPTAGINWDTPRGVIARRWSGLRGCIYALAIFLLIVGLLFGTCMILMSR